MMLHRQLTMISRISSAVNSAALRKPSPEDGVYSSPERLTPRSRTGCIVSARTIWLADVRSSGRPWERSPGITPPLCLDFGVGLSNRHHRRQLPHIYRKAIPIDTKAASIFVTARIERRNCATPSDLSIDHQIAKQ